MVVHQASGEAPCLRGSRRVGNKPENFNSVVIGEEDRQALAIALVYIVRAFESDDAGEMGHGNAEGCNSTTVN